MKNVPTNKKKFDKSIKAKKQNKTTTDCENMQSRNYYLGTSEKGYELIKKKDEEQGVQKPYLISVLPILFQEEFKNLLIKEFPDYNDNVLVHKGSIWADNVIYNHIDTLKSTEQMPEILLTNDLNSIFHKKFLNLIFEEEKWHLQDYYFGISGENVKRNCFSKLLGVLAYDMLVMVVRKSEFLYDLSQPREWYELLNPKLEQRMIIPGDRDFFCNSFFFPFIKRFGLTSIDYLKNNIKDRIHPEEMLWMINSGNDKDISLFVMPYSYAKKISNNLDYDIVFPEDGEIGIPIHMMVKNSTYERYPDIIDFLFGKKLGEAFERLGYYSTNKSVRSRYGSRLVNTIDWDYLMTNNVDLKLLKRKIDDILK